MITTDTEYDVEVPKVVDGTVFRKKKGGKKKSKRKTKGCGCK